VECLLSKCKTLSSNPQDCRKKEEEGEEEEEEGIKCLERLLIIGNF
jgi:hypothetical protein